MPDAKEDLCVCPTCGSPVRVETSDEGTSHYVPIEAVEKMAAEMRRETGMWSPHWDRS